MKDDDEGGDEGDNGSGGEGSGEGVMEVLRGFASSHTDKQTDICDCRVAFATEKV